MNDKDLRTKLIRLAHQKPGLRAHLLPLLAQAKQASAVRGDLIEAYVPYLKSPDYEDDLKHEVPDIIGNVAASVAASVLGNIVNKGGLVTVGAKFKPFKTIGSNTHEGGRKLEDNYGYDLGYYGYTIEYPKQVVLGGVFNLDLDTLWVAEHASRKYLKGNPPLAGMFLQEVIKGISVALAGEAKDFNAQRNLLYYTASLDVEEWLYEKFKIDIDVSTTYYGEDGEEEEANESYSPKVTFRFIVGDLALTPEFSGTKLKVKAILPVELRDPDVLAPRRPRLFYAVEGDTLIGPSTSRVAARYLIALVVPFRRDRAYAEMVAFTKRAKDLAAKVEAVGPLLAKGDAQLSDVGVSDAKVPFWDSETLFYRMEGTLRGRKDKAEGDDLPNDYWAQLRYDIQSFGYTLTEMRKQLEKLSRWAGELAEVLWTGDIEQNRVYYGDDGLTDAEVRALQGAVEAAQALVASAARMGQRIERTLTEPAFGKQPNDRQDVETLYHASINARKLLQSGFDRSLPNESSSAGLGGSQSIGGGRRGISFTDDLYVAKEIARVLKEVVMVARGDVGWNQIMGWVARSGKERQILAHYANYRAEGGFDDEEKAMALYLSYLNFSGRYDPKFFGVGGPKGMVAKFKGVNIRDVGYIVARVDLTDPDIVYGSGEREWRVPPEAVLKVTKFV